VPRGDYLDFMKKEVVPQFEKAYPKVTVKVEPEPDGGQLDARIAAGDAPNLWVGVFGYLPAKYAKVGKLVDMDDLPGSKELFNRIDENFIHRDYGGLYYVPWNATTQMLIYNKDLFKKAGLDPNKPPKTFDEYLEYAKKIDALPAQDGKEVYGNTFWNNQLSSGGWYWTMLAQIYYNMNDGKYQLFNKYGTDIVFDKEQANMDEFFRFAREAQKYAPKTMDPEKQQDFFSRNTGMWIQYGYGWKTNLEQAKGKPMKIGKDVSVAPLPTLKKGQTSWSTLDGRALMIFKGDKAEEQASWEFTKFLMKDDINLKACKELGQLPTLKSIKDDPYFKRPETKPFVDQLEHTLPNEAFAVLDPVSNELLQTYQQVVVDRSLTPEEGVKQAAEKARKILRKEK
jgi:multiple sugar transport system substrate-binding protein